LILQIVFTYHQPFLAGALRPYRHCADRHTCSIVQKLNTVGRELLGISLFCSGGAAG